MQTAICLLLVVFFLLMNAFFVIAEFALVRVRKSPDGAWPSPREAPRRRRPPATLTDARQRLPVRLPAGHHAGIAGHWAGWASRPFSSSFWKHRCSEHVGACPRRRCIPWRPWPWAIFIVTTLHVVVGELIPKSFAIFATERYALHTAGPLCACSTASPTRSWSCSTASPTAVVRLTGHDPANEHEVYTGEEIKLLIDESTESGLIDPEQNEFVDNIFDLGDKDAEAIMTPRTDVICHRSGGHAGREPGTSSRQYKYTRYPVCRRHRRTASWASCT